MGSELNRPAVAVVAGHPLWPNMEAELNTFGKLLEDHFERHLVAGEGDPSASLRRSFDLFYPVQPPSPDYRGARYALRAARRYLAEYSPDIIFNIAQQVPVGVAVVLTASRTPGTTAVLRVAGESFRLHELEETWIGRLQKWVVHRKGIELAGRLADAVLTLGPTLKSKLVESGIPSARLYALPNLFDCRQFQSFPGTEKEAKEKIGLDPSREVILFVGRVSVMKGADRLLAIVQHVVREREGIQFCIVGDGPLLAEFRQFPSEQVHLPGRVPYANIAPYYHASDLLVHPSRTEGLPNVILEAIAAGVPVIAAPVGEIPRYASETANQPEEYAEYILQREWHPPARPDWFDLDVLRGRYLSFLNELLSLDD